MNLEEARNNIGAEVELDESTKPYTFMGCDGNEWKKLYDFDDSKCYEIISVDNLGNAILEIDGSEISPRHLKLKPQNYKIHVPTEAESREAQELFFELGYEWRLSGSNLIQLGVSDYIFTDGIYLIAGLKVREVNEKKITIQDLREMVAKKKGIKHTGFDLANSEDKTVVCVVKSRHESIKASSEYFQYQARNEMTWLDAFKAVAGGKEVDYYNDHYGEWENVKDLSIREVIENNLKFRLTPQRITLNGSFTKEELLQKIEEME